MFSLCSQRCLTVSNMPDLLFPAQPKKEVPPSEDRVFFEVVPDADAKASIARLGRRVGADCRLGAEPFDLDRLHVSLCFVGMHADVTDAVLARAHEAASTVRMRPFVVAFNCMTRFSKGSGKRPLVLIGDDGVGGLTALQHALGAAMQQTGFGRRRSPGYTPHITLMYGALPIGEQMIEPIRWTVRDFVLIRSVHGERRHIHLDRWPLRA
jgi:RNA 2',3'-cyclic 3'-phosphodiesterase